MKSISIARAAISVVLLGGALAGCASDEAEAEFKAMTSAARAVFLARAVAARGGDEAGRSEFARLQEAGAPMFEVLDARPPRGTKFYVLPAHRAGIGGRHERLLNGHTGVVAPEPPIRDSGNPAYYWRVIMDDGATYYVHANPDDFFRHAEPHLRQINPPAEVGQRMFAAMREAGRPTFVVREGYEVVTGVRFRTRPEYRDVLTRTQLERLEGQLGVVVSDEAINVETRDNHGYWRVVLEEGGSYWVRAKADDFFAYSSAFYAPTDPEARQANEARDRLFANADIYITDRTLNGSSDDLHLSNGARIREDSVNAYRAIAADLPDPTPEDLGALSRFNVVEDFVSGRTYIRSPRGNSGSSRFEPALELFIVKTGRRYALRSDVQFESRQWIFATRFTIAADDYRWEPPATNAWRRNVWGDTVLEAISAPISSNMREAAEQLATAERGVVRFYGRSRTVDRELTARSKHDLAAMLELYDALSR